MALLHFKECALTSPFWKPDFGGRLDSTNVVMPQLALITEIGFDHTKVLGNRLRTIAGEKAGILKPGVPTIIGATNPGVREYFDRSPMRGDSPSDFPGKTHGSHTASCPMPAANSIWPLRPARTKAFS